MKPIPTTSRIAVVTGNQEHAMRDRDTLLRLDFHDIQMFVQAGEALDFMTKAPVDLVLVDSATPDMPPYHLIRVIKNNTRFRLTPVIMVTLENRLENVLDAIGAGCSGYILRPYSLATFERHLELAWRSSRIGEVEREQLDTADALLKEGRFAEAAAEFNEIVADPDESLRLFDTGVKFLIGRNFGKAIACFNEAVSQNEMFAEAYRGLAYAHKGQGDEEAYAAFLKKAAESFAFQDRLQDTKEIFVEIVKAEPDAQNPYNSLGVELRRKGDLGGAMHAYEQALLLSPQDEVVHYNIAKALYAIGDPAKASNFAREAMSINPEFYEAAELIALIEADTLAGPDQCANPQPRRNTPGPLTLDLDDCPE
jgi:tetratricopeptide (TPR) repeat protein